jgi:putative spermidine/putrescine transport system ATP-binding protein
MLQTLATPSPTPPATRYRQALTLDAITHSYGTGHAVQNVTLEVRDGELIALLGPSGCGKSTLLRIIAGFVTQTSGRVVIADQAVDHLPPNRREVGIVFQSYALFPHMTVADNVAYGLAARKVAKSERMARAKAMLDVVQMSRFADRYPRQLSGGQQQRVALARSLVLEPKLLLLDEPFAALDKNLRLDMQIEIKRLQRQFGLTAILVTHDQDEAMSIADRIAVMSMGRIEQLDTPVAVYDRPATLFVNSFIGSCNLFEGTVVDRSGPQTTVRLLNGATWTLAWEGAAEPGAEVLVSVRPEQMQLFDDAAADRIPTKVVLSLPIAGSVLHDLATTTGQGFKVEARRSSETRMAGGQICHAGVTPDARPNIFLKQVATEK